MCWYPIYLLKERKLLDDKQYAIFPQALLLFLFLIIGIIAILSLGDSIWDRKALLHVLENRQIVQAVMDTLRSREELLEFSISVVVRVRKSTLVGYSSLLYQKSPAAAVTYLNIETPASILSS